MYHVDTNTPSSSVIKLKIDFGATCHYLKTEHSSYLKNCTKLYHGPQATVTNNSLIQATPSGLLPLRNILSPHAKIHRAFQDCLINP